MTDFSKYALRKTTGELVYDFKKTTDEDNNSVFLYSINVNNSKNGDFFQIEKNPSNSDTNDNSSNDFLPSTDKINSILPNHLNTVKTLLSRVSATVLEHESKPTCAILLETCLAERRQNVDEFVWNKFCPI
jgi:hypothetical protein